MTHALPTRFGIGQPVLRTEDPRLLKGKGRFVDDFNLPHQAYAVFVRSPHAHAEILSIDARAAIDMPGVLAVLTGADYAADGLGPITGGAFNPAVGLGPAIVELVLGEGASPLAWVYAVGPLAGGAAAAYAFKYQEAP